MRSSRSSWAGWLRASVSWTRSCTARYSSPKTKVQNVSHKDCSIKSPSTGAAYNQTLGMNTRAFCLRIICDHLTLSRVCDGGLFQKVFKFDNNIHILRILLIWSVGKSAAMIRGLIIFQIDTKCICSYYDNCLLILRFLLQNVELMMKSEQ